MKDKDSKAASEELKKIRDKISHDIKNMGPEELKRYIDEKLKQHPPADKKNRSK